MNFVSLNDAKNIYLCFKEYRIKKYHISNDTFKDFCFKLKKFERELNNEVEDEYWKLFLKPLKKYRFELSASPLPFNQNSIAYNQVLIELKALLKNCKFIYPGYEQQAVEILLIFESLISSPKNPFLDLFLEKFTDISYVSSALLLKEAYLIERADEIISSTSALTNLNLVSCTQLKKGICFDRIIIIGPPQWFPDYIFNSPRGKELVIVNYFWVKDSLEKKQTFVKSFFDSHLPSETSSDTAKTSVNNESFLEHQELLPHLNWEDILARAVKRTSNDEMGQTEVLAKLFILEDNSMVFLDASENSKILALDIDEDLPDEEDSKNDTRIARIPVSEVIPGMFIILRTSGGGDYIISIADRILGQYAQQVREIQNKWKTLLKKIVNEQGLFPVCISLIDFGSSKANEVNVRNWMSNKNIKPADFSDFEAILKLLGLNNKANEIWQAAEMIDKAHRMAGFQIRRMLLEQINTQDLTQLEKIGKMEFQLPEVDGGSLTAFRVKMISPEKYIIPETRLGHIIN